MFKKIREVFYDTDQVWKTVI